MKDSEIKLDGLDQAAYDRILDEGHVVDYHMSNPIVKLPNMDDLPDKFERLDPPEEPFEDSHPTCAACGATDEWDLCFKLSGPDGNARVVKCMATRTGFGGQQQTCGRLALAYEADDGPIEYLGHVDT